MQIINTKGKFSELEIDRIGKVQMFICFLSSTRVTLLIDLLYEDDQGHDKNWWAAEAMSWGTSEARNQCQNRGDGSRWERRQFPGCNEQEAKDTWLSAHMIVGETVAESGRPLLNAAVFFMRKYGLLLWMRREEGDHCFKRRKEMLSESLQEMKGCMSPSLEHMSGEHWERRASILVLIQEVALMLLAGDHTQKINGL